jgi:amino acid transporter, AAT family
VKDDSINAPAAGGEDKLSRSLRSRHIQLIAIGGTIGVGLFLGSARAISNAGPGLLLSYAIGGIAIFFIMRALGELLTYRPVAGAFASYADEFVSPLAGFITGWSYWFMWVTVGMAEITAIGIYVHNVFPDVPQWLPALISLGLLYGANLFAVRVYGEMEFWFALIKVGMILALIVTGLVVLSFGVGELGPTASITNLWSHGGFFPFGIVGVLLTLQIVMFAYAGVELIGVTAGEAQNPAESLPKATNSIIYRILLFYIGALIIIMALVPWNQLDPAVSPFVLVFEKIGLPGAAGLITFVVITAAASSCNGGIYSTGRMLYSLALRKQAPQAFGKLSDKQVPVTGIHASAALMLVGVVLNYFVPEQVFVWLTSVATIAVIWAWLMILISHVNYRRAVAEGRAHAVAFRMPGAPVMNWIVIAFLVIVTGMLAIDPGTRVALYVAPVWFLLLLIGYSRLRSTARVAAETP